MSLTVSCYFFFGKAADVSFSFLDRCVFLCVVMCRLLKQKEDGLSWTHNSTAAVFSSFS